MIFHAGHRETLNAAVENQLLSLTYTCWTNLDSGYEDEKYSPLVCGPLQALRRPPPHPEAAGSDISVTVMITETKIF